MIVGDHIKRKCLFIYLFFPLDLGRIIGGNDFTKEEQEIVRLAVANTKVCMLIKVTLSW